MSQALPPLPGTTRTTNPEVWYTTVPGALAAFAGKRTRATSAPIGSTHSVSLTLPTAAYRARDIVDLQVRHAVALELIDAPGRVQC